MNTSCCDYLKKQSTIIEKRLEELVSAKEKVYPTLFLAARHALLGGGKRLRPIFTLATAEMFGASSLDALDAACAIEMVHTYSMIHDDLPCMDNDDYRRGRLTVHRQFDEASAVLAGDYLLTYAFEILATLPHFSDEKKVRLLTILSQRSGAEGMIGGQAIDLALEGKKASLDSLQTLHLKKTAALLTASLEFGAVIGDASQEQMKILCFFGEKIGLIFQIIDDILDVTSSQTKHGNKISSDFLNDKSTYVTLLGIERSRRYVQEAYHQAIHALSQLNCNFELLRQLAEIVIHRDH